MGPNGENGMVEPLDQYHIDIKEVSTDMQSHDLHGQDPLKRQMLSPHPPPPQRDVPTCQFSKAMVYQSL